MILAALSGGGREAVFEFDTNRPTRISLGNLAFYREAGGERATWENPFLGMWKADDGSRVEFRGNGTVFFLGGSIAFPGREGSGNPAQAAQPAPAAQELLDKIYELAEKNPAVSPEAQEALKKQAEDLVSRTPLRDLFPKKQETPRPAPAQPPAATAPAAAPVQPPEPAAQAPARPDSREEALRSKIVSSAQKYLGARYAYGAMNPPSRFDCSGFVGQAYKEATGYAIPRSSTEIFRTGKKIERESLQPGDIIVFDTTGRGKASHVALYLNDTSMIHSVSGGSKTGVIISPLTDRYFAPRIIGYRSFVAANLTAMNMVKGFGDSRPVTDFDLDISERASSMRNELPIAAGTGVRFDLYNETGKPGDFELFFYPLGAGRSQGDRESFSLGVKEDHLSRAFYPGPGQYKLEVLSGGTVHLEQSWKVE